MILSVITNSKPINGQLYIPAQWSYYSIIENYNFVLLCYKKLGKKWKPSKTISPSMWISPRAANEIIW